MVEDHRSDAATVRWQVPAEVLAAAGKREAGGIVENHTEDGDATVRYESDMRARLLQASAARGRRMVVVHSGSIALDRDATGDTPPFPPLDELTDVTAPPRFAEASNPALAPEAPTDPGTAAPETVAAAMVRAAATPPLAMQGSRRGPLARAWSWLAVRLRALAAVVRPARGKVEPAPEMRPPEAPVAPRYYGTKTTTQIQRMVARRRSGPR